MMAKVVQVGDLPEGELDVSGDEGLLVDLGNDKLLLRTVDLDSDALALAGNDLVVYLDDVLDTFHCLHPSFSGNLFVPFC